MLIDFHCRDLRLGETHSTHKTLVTFPNERDILNARAALYDEFNKHRDPHYRDARGYVISDTGRVLAVYHRPNDKPDLLAWDYAYAQFEPSLRLDERAPAICIALPYTACGGIIETMEDVAHWAKTSLRDRRVGSALLLWEKGIVAAWERNENGDPILAAENRGLMRLH